ncbi:MAG: GWxTD domain-containing protein [Bacteroidetes bacterium]|nr:GWxTD domain-containing protein [Bacteroidota bacterium]
MRIISAKTVYFAHWLRQYFFLSVSLFLSLFFFSQSCSQSESSRQYIADQVNPFSRKHINYAVYTRITNNQLDVHFSLQIPRNELSFIQTPQGFKANYSLRLSIKKDDSGIILDTLVTRTKTVETFAQTREVTFEKAHLNLPGGSGVYRIDGLFTDENSKSDFKVTSGYKLDPKDYEIQLSSLRFLDSDNKNDISLTKRIPVGDKKGAFFNFDVSLPVSTQDIKIELKVNSLKCDTNVARPIWGLNPIEGTIETRGYKPDVVLYTFSPLDTILRSTSAHSVEFTLPVPDTLKSGVYTGQVFLRYGEKVFTSKKETFFIFPKGYPYIKSMKDAVEIVRYLATASEYESIVENGDSLLKQNFDKFWLRLSNGNVEVAKRKIALFYQRAEDANHLFSTYKPGWKTDLGMLYIVLGPPETVEWRPTELSWFYSYKRAGSLIPLSFNPIRVDDVIVGYSFDRYYDYYTYDDFWSEYRREWERNLK